MTAPVSQVNINSDKWTDFISKFNTAANIISTAAVTLDGNNDGSFTVNGSITISNTGTFKLVSANNANITAANVVSISANTVSVTNGLTANVSTFNVTNTINGNANNVSANNITVLLTANINSFTSNTAVVRNSLTANSVTINHHVSGSATDTSQHITIANNYGFSVTANSFNVVTEGRYDVIVNGNVVARFSNTSPMFAVPLAVTSGGTGANSASGVRNAIGLGNVDNTSDVNKPVSTAQQNALDGKQNLLETQKVVRYGKNGIEGAVDTYFYPTANTDNSAYGMVLGRSAGENGGGYIIQTGTGSFIIQNYDGVINFATNQTVRVNNNIIGNNAFRNITVSTSAPSGGSAGDIWLMI